jgi:hypothetical protein
VDVASISIVVLVAFGVVVSVVVLVVAINVVLNVPFVPNADTAVSVAVGCCYGNNCC